MKSLAKNPNSVLLESAGGITVCTCWGNCYCTIVWGKTTRVTDQRRAPGKMSSSVL